MTPLGELEAAVVKYTNRLDEKGRIWLLDLDFKNGWTMELRKRSGKRMKDRSKMEIKA